MSERVIEFDNIVGGQDGNPETTAYISVTPRPRSVQ